MRRIDDSDAGTVLEPVGVLGVGVEGRATIDYLLAHGIRRITALDRNPVEGLPPEAELCFGAEHDAGLGRFATVFRSPGIRPDHPSLAAARDAGARITSALSLFLARCPAPCVGVTGTLGKGTASSLAAAMLERSGFTVHLGGNIGANPLAFLDRVEPGHRVVLEISSFQAFDIAASPEVGVILKTTSEHLDWHRDVREYRAAKANLLRHQGPDGTVVYNADSEGSREIAMSAVGRKQGYSLGAEVEEGIFLRGETLVLRQDRRETALPIALDRLRMKGRFNLENLAAAILASVAAGGGVLPSCAAGESFAGLPHRLEFVVEGRGHRYYNDSYATRPEASLGALASFSGEPLAVILGGSEKYADFTALAEAVASHPDIRHVALIGATAARLAEAIDRSGPCRFPVAFYDNLEPAMEGAAAALPGGGVVLLTPACASFGLFPNYKVRGERFRAKARELASQKL